MSKANEPAFPEIHTTAENPVWDSRVVYGDTRSTGGLTKREYFAAMAMMGINANSIPGSYHQSANCAREAVEDADALLAELVKSSTSPCECSCPDAQGTCDWCRKAGVTS